MHIGFVDDLDKDQELLGVFGGGVWHRDNPSGHLFLRFAGGLAFTGFGAGADRPPASPSPCALLEGVPSPQAVSFLASSRSASRDAIVDARLKKPQFGSEPQNRGNYLYWKEVMKCVKSKKKRSPDWLKLLATLISILIMIAQFEAVRLGAWPKDQTAAIMAIDDCRSIIYTYQGV